MKLTIRRDQAAKKGVFGGHKGMIFSLYCKVEISSEEQELSTEVVKLSLAIRL